MLLPAQTRACWNTTKPLFLTAFPFKLTCDASQAHPRLPAQSMDHVSAQDVSASAVS